MDLNKLNSWIYRALAGDADAWLTFDELDKLLARDAKDLRDEVRRSYLRGELGRMIASGQIVRDKNTARYKPSDDVNLF
ncbi:MAG: hypothetical protein IIZ83_01570 [Oscillospiraceae bacterium]|nr:hypothetical protein [Oscillospiraceae bacterium]